MESIGNGAMDQIVDAGPVPGDDNETGVGASYDAHEPVDRARSAQLGVGGT
jgi:hypothetical protein